MASQVVAAGNKRDNAYDIVRSHLIGRKFSEQGLPRSQWFEALAEAGLTACLAGLDDRAGLLRLLKAAEVFGGYNLPLSFGPVATTAAAMSASDNLLASDLLSRMLAGGAPVLPALPSRAKRQADVAGYGLTARRVAGAGWSVTGKSNFVPDAEQAAYLLADAEGPDGLLVFLFEPKAAGVSLSSRPTADGGIAGSFSFADARIAEECVLAQGKDAAELRDHMYLAVQLGLGAELAGLGAALMTRVGASHVSEATLADKLMDVTLARAFVFGAAELAGSGKRDALEIASGARAMASNAALSAARLALSSVPHRETIEPLVRRALVASQIYGSPQAYMARFMEWCWSRAASTDNFAVSFGAASCSACISDLIDACARVNSYALNSGMAADPVFRNRIGHVQAEMFALICADAQQRAGSDIPSRFVDAAARRTRAKLVDCALHAAGSQEAFANIGNDIAEWFIAANAL